MKNLLYTIVLFISFLSYGQSESYQGLQRSLKAFSDNPNITVFVDTDYNFSGTSLSTYLQVKEGLASKDFKYVKNNIIEVFVPKASNKTESITIEYHVTHRDDVIGYVDADTVSIINSVTIKGTPRILANLFLNFWPDKVEVHKEGNQNIATKELMSDSVSMKLLPDGTAVINIVKGKTTVDYVSTYGINKTK